MKKLELNAGDTIICPFCDHSKGTPIQKIVSFGWMKRSKVRYINLDCKHIITVWKQE